MSSKTVLVTGGAGFIGSHLCEHLLARGDRVVCYDNFDPYYAPETKAHNLSAIRRHPRFHLVRADILDADQLTDTMRSFGVERVAHLAAQAGVRPSLAEPAHYYRVNVEGSANVLEAARVAGVEGVALASSSSVYGARQGTPFHEDDPGDAPVSPYAASKRAMELAAHTCHHLWNLPVVCLRLFTVYGPRQRPEMAIARFADRIRRGVPIDMYGDGGSRRDYTFVHDIVRGIVAALDRAPALGFRIINLGNAETTSLRALIDALGAVIGVEPLVTRRPAQPGDVPATLASIDRARTLLDYAPQTDLREGLRQYVAWLDATSGVPASDNTVSAPSVP